MSRVGLLLLSLVVFGCHHIPPRESLESSSGRTEYNMSIQRTNSSEMLLNLVRLRYYDTPFFMDVSNITTQYTYKALAAPTLPIPGFSKTNPFTLGSEFSWQDQPTIQYTPLEGQKFAKHLLQPLDLSIIQQLVYAGWDIDRLFRLAIQNIDRLINAPLGSGPEPEMIVQYRDFFEATKLMRYFQIHGTLRVGVKEDEKEEVLQIAFPTKGKEAQRLAQLLGDVHIVEDMYVISMLHGYTTKGNIGVLPRSLLSCMYYLCLGVEVPDFDVERGKVLMPYMNGQEYEWRDVIHDLITIKNSRTQPKDAYVSVFYRNYWFYIDDSDLKSKRTFMLLQQLYNLETVEKRQVPPLLTLPLG